jgi:hypothetical protein
LVNRDWPTGRIREVSEESSAAWIECVDLAVLDVVANENSIAEWTEIRWG